MTIGQYVIHLLKCALLDLEPQEKPDNISFESIFYFSEAHMLANTVWYGINKLRVKPQKELWDKWTELKNMAMVKDIKQRNEYKNIISAIDKAGVPCMPLKGIVLKKYYPRTEFRTMADIDVFVDEKNISKVKKILLAFGFTCDSEGEYHHDVFTKPPIMNIEVHRELIPARMKKLSQYYKDAFSKAQHVDGYNFIYKMSDEEFYIYVLAHFYKHYEGGGSGIRSVMDVYVLNHSIYNNINKESLNLKLKQLNLMDFRNEITDLSESWFGDGVVAENLQGAESYIFGSGTYGTISNQINRQIDKFGRFGYLVYSAFPSYTLMKEKYKILKKASFLLPFCWVIRWIKCIFFPTDVCKYKFKYIFDKNDLIQKSHT